MMRAQIALITIFTDDMPAMLHFYRDVLGFEPQHPLEGDAPGYVEFKHDGVRFALCRRAVMSQVGIPGYTEPFAGHPFELAFPCDSPEDVDTSYADLVARGATPVQGPADMPWNQRTGFIADPDGNIHEIFADLPGGA
jgi:lactoylglutathione lyase